MPKYYQTDAEVMGRVMPRAVAEQLIGSDETKRVTKTYMPDRRFAAIATRIANHYKRIIEKLRLLHFKETGEVLTDEEVYEEYEAPKTWKGFHDWLVEHLGSLEGFTTKAAVRAEMLRESENKPTQAAIPDGSRQNGPPPSQGGGGF